MVWDFILLSLPANKLACHSLRLVEDMRLLGQRQETITHSSSSNHRISICTSFLRPISHRATQICPDRSLHMQWTRVWERNPEVKKLKYFILDNKHACSLLPRETLSLSFKDVIYTKIFEKIACNKGNSCLTWKVFRYARDPWRIVFCVLKSRKMFIASSHNGNNYALQKTAKTNNKKFKNCLLHHS